MNKFLLAEKLNMTQVFTEDGKVVPATVLKVLPQKITLLRNKDRDGYAAVQVGAGEKREKNINKAQKKTGNFRYFREFRVKSAEEHKEGEELTPTLFEEGDVVEVSGVSKGKGFQGVVKKYGFKGGPRTHGQKHSEREGGSIGATGPQEVRKGMRMPGRMGGEKITVRNLRVVDVDEKKGLLYISGAVPGRRGTLIEVSAKAGSASG